ncbi:hypothetical protein KM792_11485 [Clostridium tyrobutyricum]|jgi:hypothetical protein|uniref:hypothetical protein n=2 Tax=Clostridium tyrobutyricum TaxID=1519 RepID=UPI0010C5997A|nr:hypothetical protein [Clostridium tyrobutyricum]MBV4423440.1 hypothetical protein [Clostridium tyrobutyricum]MBV4427162.1 hypothetical protein [Clostridium tyrobutyricum]MBV4432264.1 hypothetical protein [Clostridium tyrobutyricum]MBV4440226.1 hypothetical protein [Clostridium tyrobutyricum]MBV4442503.1 hypothetical protein [Clostridium tyrobutyricum]
MDKIQMANMESKLRDYFNRDKRMRALNMKLNILKKQIDEIGYKLRNVKVNLPEESRSMVYEERVQTSHTGESYAERTLLRITDKLLREQSWKIEQIADIEERLRNMESSNSVIEVNIKDLRIEDKDFLKEKYKYRKADWQIGMKFNMTQGAVTKRRHRLIENIANWEPWVSTVN